MSPTRFLCVMLHRHCYRYELQSSVSRTARSCRTAVPDQRRSNHSRRQSAQQSSAGQYQRFGRNSVRAGLSRRSARAARDQLPTGAGTRSEARLHVPGDTAVFATRSRWHAKAVLLPGAALTTLRQPPSTVAVSLLQMSPPMAEATSEGPVATSLPSPHTAPRQNPSPVATAGSRHISPNQPPVEPCGLATLAAPPQACSATTRAALLSGSFAVVSAARCTFPVRIRTTACSGAGQHPNADPPQSQVTGPVVERAGTFYSAGLADPLPASWYASGAQPPRSAAHKAWRPPEKP